ncbi:MAG: hypothetical protein WKF30_15140 [Pyrinomonadaceae bacterium]
MSQSRIDALVEMVKNDQENELIWCGLANEYAKAEMWSAAAESLDRVVRLKPDYTAAYQLLGTVLNHQGKAAEARNVWAEGIKVAARTGAWKARQHMESLMLKSDETENTDLHPPV